jgi:hypothetical protein
MRGDMNMTMSALQRVVPGIEGLAFGPEGKAINEEVRSTYVTMWSLAEEIDRDMGRLKEYAESLSRRFSMYAESLERGILGEGLDIPTRSSYISDLTQSHAALGQKRRTLLLITSFQLGRGIRDALEREMST